jgi:hypothetical protein
MQAIGHEQKSCPAWTARVHHAPRRRCGVAARGARAAAHAAVVVVPKTTVQMRVEPRYYKIVGKAGKAVERGFCPTCGSQVTVKLERLRMS